MKKLFTFCALAASLAACTANMEVRQSLTERGFVNTPGYELGEVWQWAPETNQLLPVTRIEGVASQSRVEEAATLNVGFETDASFAGGLNLTRQQELALESEVKARTSSELLQASTSTVRNPISSIIADWRSNPELWRNELGITGFGWPDDSTPIYLVLINRQTYAESLEVKVGNETAAGTEFVSGVRTAQGNVSFRVIDTASLSILAGNVERTPVFYDITIVRALPGSDGETPRFSTRDVDPAITKAVREYFLGG